VNPRAIYGGRVTAANIRLKDRLSTVCAACCGEKNTEEEVMEQGSNVGTPEGNGTWDLLVN